MAGPARGLYTSDILAAATGLSAFPWIDDLPLRGEARSRSCGSSITLALSIDADGGIARLGLRPHACAVGQAAAYVFATYAPGRSLGELEPLRAALAAWLAGAEAPPDWPGIELLEPARAYPARHAAILLAWDAAISALG